jgi:hypothetical protein
MELKPAPSRDDSNWRSVRTMPRDGSWFWAKSPVEIRFVHYADKYDRLPIDGSGRMWTSLPTNWMPQQDQGAKP